MADRDRQDQALSGGDDSVEAAIGKDGHVSGTASTVARSGRRSSEGTGNPDTAPDAGDPGGMGGAGARSRTRGNRPPGGVSPVEDDGERRD